MTARWAGFAAPARPGILGGGQLGRMLIQAGIDFDCVFRVLDADSDAPCRPFAREFVTGDPTDFETVLAFGRECDALTIEIENVNADALEALRDYGTRVLPSPEVLRVFQDKIKQKEYYRGAGIPTAEFIVLHGRPDPAAHAAFLPAVQKLARSGYDGRGVARLRSVADFDAKAFDAPSVLEREVDMVKEIAVLAARSAAGAVIAYDPVEMVFDPEYNLVDFLLAPADLEPGIAARAMEIAEALVVGLGLVGLLAVEMFLTSDGRLLVNEAAPRAHNSAHHTMRACPASQFEQQIRILCGLPFGSTALRGPAAMLNLLGAPGFAGPARFAGAEKVLATPDVSLHLYGKKETRPFRKMGHVILLGGDHAELTRRVRTVKQILSVQT